MLPPLPYYNYTLIFYCLHGYTQYGNMKTTLLNVGV